MPRVKKQTPPRLLRSGDKVRRIESETLCVYVIFNTDPIGRTADICLKDTNLEWYRYPMAKLELIESLEEAMRKLP